MSESDQIPSKWVKSCNELVDEIWVPTDWHKNVFSEAGVRSDKIYVIPEPTDVWMWDPQSVESRKIQGKRNEDYNFFSVFKWYIYIIFLYLQKQY
jgi:hypothetical protein